MANSTQPARRTQQPDTPDQLAARTPEHSVNTVPLDRTTLSTLKARIDQIEYDIVRIFTLISPCKRNSTAHEAARHLNATDPENEPLTAPKQCPARDSGHLQTDASSSRDSVRGSTRSSSIFTNTDAGDLVTPWANSSVGTMMTFNLDMGEVSPRKRKRRSNEEQEQTNEIRSRGACDECRSKKRQCNLQHTPSKPVAKKRGRGYPHRSLDLSPSRSTQAKISQGLQVRPPLISKTPPLHCGTNGRRASLPNLNLPGPDLSWFSGNRRAHGVHKSSSPSVQLADYIYQDQPSMIPPRQSYPLCSEPYLDARHCPGTVGTAWVTPYPPDPRVSQGHLLSPYFQGYINYPEDYATRSGFSTNTELRLTEFDSLISNDDWLHLDDSHQAQGMRPSYHDGFYRDRSGISHSMHQTQETTALTRTQDFSYVPRKSPRLLQARLQKSENADPKALAGNPPAHQAVDLHSIPSLPPIGSSTDQSPLPLQSSGHPVSSQGFSIHSRGSSPENPGIDWDEDLVTL